MSMKMMRNSLMIALVGFGQTADAGEYRANSFTQFLAQQDTASMNLSEGSLVATEVLCYINNDCIDTTFCCSNYSCVHPDKCLLGEKNKEDYCDYNFECYSRCCS